LARIRSSEPSSNSGIISTVTSMSKSFMPNQARIDQDE